MDLQLADGGEARFAAYVEGLVNVIGHAGPGRPLLPGLDNAMRAQERRADGGGAGPAVRRRQEFRLRPRTRHRRVREQVADPRSLITRFYPLPRN
jgi:hypothetical protein